MVVEHYFVMCSCKRTWEGLTKLMKFKGRLHIIIATIQVVVLHPTLKCNTIPILFSFMCSCSKIVNLNSINFSGGVEIHTLGQMSQHDRMSICLLSYAQILMVDGSPSKNLLNPTSDYIVCLTWIVKMVHNNLLMDLGKCLEESVKTRLIVPQVN